MKLPLRTDWAPMAEIPVTSTPPPSPTRGRQHQSSVTPPHTGGSEADKHHPCSLALGSLCHGGTIAEAAAHSGLTEGHVSRILQSYGIEHIIANQKHQADDGVQIGPWTRSRLHQSGHQRFKNDFHSWHYCWVMGLSVDEALHALCSWPEFMAIQARLTKDYPHTWRKFARTDIARCYEKFASFNGPALVSNRTQARVEKAVMALNKQSFTTKELLPLLQLSRRQVQRALGQLGTLRRKGSKRGSRWELQSPGQTSEQDSVSTASPILTATSGVTSN